MLESLVGAPANSLSASQYYPGLKAEACSDAVVAQLQLLHAAILAEGGLLPTAMAISAECGYLSMLLWNPDFYVPKHQKHTVSLRRPKYHCVQTSLNTNSNWGERALIPARAAPQPKRLPGLVTDKENSRATINNKELN